MPGPYSSARAGKVAACERAASCWKTGQVFAAGPGIVASTTRAPSDSSRSTHASAASLASVSRPSARLGARRRRPTVRPASRGSGTSRPVRTDQRVAASRTVRAIGPTVSKRRAEREDAVDRDGAEPGLQADDLARGRRKPHRAARVRPEPELAEARGDRGRVPARRAAGRPARPSRVAHGAVPRVVAEHAPGELDEVRLAEDGRARVEHAVDDARVALGDVVAVDPRAVGRPDPGGVDQVLDEQRAPRERPGRALPPQRLVEPGDPGVPRVGLHRGARVAVGRARQAGMWLDA